MNVKFEELFRYRELNRYTESFFVWYGYSISLIRVPCSISFDLPPWRNWLARSAVNRKVGGSSPPGGAF